MARLHSTQCKAKAGSVRFLAPHLVSGELQCAWSNPGIQLAVLVQHGGEAAARSPLQDEAEWLQHDADELDDVSVLEAVQDGHL